MFVDYDYYKNTFKGADLTENEFSKYAAMACMQITASTLSRVNDKAVNNYPPELVPNIKNCACAISEFLHVYVDNFKPNTPRNLYLRKLYGKISIQIIFTNHEHI